MRNIIISPTLKPLFNHLDIDSSRDNLGGSFNSTADVRKTPDIGGFLM